MAAAPEASAHSSAYDPKDRIGVVVLSNASTPSGVDDIGLHLLNPKLPLANAEPPKSHTEIQLDPKLLDNYTGRYQLPDRILEITRDGGRLFAQAFGQQGMAGPCLKCLPKARRTSSSSRLARSSPLKLIPRAERRA
jgi:hypothetical protein